MSRSYGRYKSVGAIGGSNTEFYRKRNQYVRRKNRAYLKDLLAKFPVDYVGDYYTCFSLPRKDTRKEPTDGTSRINSELLCRFYTTGIYLYDGKHIKR